MQTDKRLIHLGGGVKCKLCEELIPENILVVTICNNQNIFIVHFDLMCNLSAVNNIIRDQEGSVTPPSSF